MRNTPVVIFLLAAGMLAHQAALWAHHGNAAYDTTKEVTVTGVVTQWMVANPHSILKVDVTDDKGNVVHWIIESSAPSANQARIRLTRDSLKPGDKVTVTLIPAKNDQPVGRIHRLVLPDGRIVNTELP